MRSTAGLFGSLVIFLFTTQALAMGQPLPGDSSEGSASASSGSSSQSPSSGSTGGSTSGSTILQKYSYLDPQRIVPQGALEKVLKYYDSHKSSLGNTYYVTVIDFTKKSSTKRMYVIDMKTGKVVSYLSAHGLGSEGSSDDGYASVFSNVPGSKASSLGIYKTGNQYASDNHGIAMTLYGLESTNSNAYDRAIVLHGAWYVSPETISQTGRIGRSSGCPAVEDRYAAGLIATLKNGSLMIIWHG